jgi:hypothetical protein
VAKRLNDRSRNDPYSMPNVGLFARAGIADGNVEPCDFADIDRRGAAGLSLSGAA